MKAKAVRLHAANDLRLDEFELPEIKDDEILVKVVSDSICMSTYKCAILGTKHKRVHEDVADHPAIMGHEFAGDIVKVGARVCRAYPPAAFCAERVRPQRNETERLLFGQTYGRLTRLVRAQSHAVRHVP